MTTLVNDTPLAQKWCIRGAMQILTKADEMEPWWSATSVRLFDDWKAAGEKAKALNVEHDTSHYRSTPYYSFLREMGMDDRKREKRDARDMKHATVLPTEPFSVRSTEGDGKIWTVRHIVLIPCGDSLMHIGFLAEHDHTTISIISPEDGGKDALEWNDFEIIEDEVIA